MNMNERGTTSISVTVFKPTKDKPKGGVYNRLEKRLVFPKEKWNSVLERVLDALDAYEAAEAPNVRK